MDGKGKWTLHWHQTNFNKTNLINFKCKLFWDGLAFALVNLDVYVYQLM